MIGRRILALAMGMLASVTPSACLVADAASLDHHGGVSITRAIIVSADGGDVAAYALFVNDGAATKIIGAECDCAERVELHLIDRSGPRPTMTNSWPLDLPASATIAIAPPGSPRHLMAMGLRGTIAAGDSVAIRFRLSNGVVVEQSFVAVIDSRAAWAAYDILPTGPETRTE